MAETDDFIPTKLGIYSKFFPYKCPREEEQIMRKAANDVGYKAMEYGSYYSAANLDDLDKMRLTAFHFSLKAHRESLRNETAPILAQLNRLNIRLEDFLNRHRPKEDKKNNEFYA
ncbi:hypothetical protein AGMMS49982_13940 [Bacteroidia bacterium]|nr:hypothetical protein AGMMS49982_13940 [Bacteroidia bacterium]